MTGQSRWSDVPGLLSALLFETRAIRSDIRRLMEDRVTPVKIDGRIKYGVVRGASYDEATALLADAARQEFEADKRFRS